MTRLERIVFNARFCWLALRLGLRQGRLLGAYRRARRADDERRMKLIRFEYNAISAMFGWEPLER